MDDMFPPITAEDDECKDGFCPIKPAQKPLEVKIDFEVDQPEHYKGRGVADTIEAIDVMKAFMSTEEFNGHLRGCAMKYLLRLNSKGSPSLNARKAAWYINRLVEELSE